MSDNVNYRFERIQRLFDELRHEITRGMMEGEIDESMGFRFIVPVSKSIPNGVVWCEFRSRPVPGYAVDPSEQPTLRIVK